MTALLKQNPTGDRQFFNFFLRPAITVGMVTLTGLLVALLDAKGAIAQTARGATEPITLRSDIQEANARTGVITARGNVQIDYPARQIQATSAQAMYYSREQRIVLTGDVYVLQEGNSLRGEVVTYLIDEGRFVATPEEGEQVQSIYLVPATETATAATPVMQLPAFDPKIEFKTPISQ
jgi:lipopolysaccharide export system protein LptA